jgi:hypothetical protein
LVRQLADPVLRRQTPAGRAELLGGAAGLAASALGLRSGETRGRDSSAEELESEQAATFHGLYWFFATLAERAPRLATTSNPQRKSTSPDRRRRARVSLVAACTEPR